MSVTDQFLTPEKETRARKFGSGIFTGIASGEVLESIRDMIAAYDAECASHAATRELALELVEALEATKCSHCSNTGFGSDAEYKFKCNCGYEKRAAALARARAQLAPNAKEEG